MFGFIASTVANLASLGADIGLTVKGMSAGTVDGLVHQSNASNREDAARVQQEYVDLAQGRGQSDLGGGTSMAVSLGSSLSAGLCVCACLVLLLAAE